MTSIASTVATKMGLRPENEAATPFAIEIGIPENR
jgi:hypothetical protein